MKSLSIQLLTIEAAALCLLVCTVTAAPLRELDLRRGLPEREAHRQVREIIFRPLFVYRQQELKHEQSLEEHDIAVRHASMGGFSIRDFNLF